MIGQYLMLAPFAPGCKRHSSTDAHRNATRFPKKPRDGKGVTSETGRDARADSFAIFNWISAVKQAALLETVIDARSCFMYRYMLRQ